MDCSEIYSKQVYLTSAEEAHDINTINTLNIGGIINATGWRHDTATGTDIELCPDAFKDTVQYLHINVNDVATENIGRHFDGCYAFIQRIIATGKAVIVHCQAGISRSPTIVIAYVMKREQKRLRAAFDMVREKRPCINPNAGFWSQLEQYEAQLFGLSESTYPYHEYITDFLMTQLNNQFSRETVHTKVLMTGGDVPLTVALLFMGR